MWVQKKSQYVALAFENDQRLEETIDNDEKVGIIFMELSKAFNTINHSLLLAKLKVVHSVAGMR